MALSKSELLKKACEKINIQDIDEYEAMEIMIDRAIYLINSDPEFMSINVSDCVVLQSIIRTFLSFFIIYKHSKVEDSFQGWLEHVGKDENLINSVEDYLKDTLFLLTIEEIERLRIMLGKSNRKLRKIRQKIASRDNEK